MISMAIRANQAELMDGEDFDLSEYETTLRQLEAINRLTGGYAPTLNAVRRVVHQNLDRKLKILDVGFGGGDTLRAIARWATANRVDLDLCGVDLNPNAREYAEQVTPRVYGIRFRTMNIFDVPEHEHYDMILSSLFMHHMDDRQIVSLLRWMTERSSLAWFINDLHRHPLAYHFIKHATKAFGCTRMIQNDGPLSVARSFSRQDWERYLREAGLPKQSVEVRWHWSFRFGVFCDLTKLGQGLKS